MKKQIVLRKIRSASERVLNRYVPDYYGEDFLCPVCCTKLAYFTPLSFYFLRELDKHQFVYSIFQSETLNLEHYTCPKCGASDRDRLYALYLKEKFTSEREYKLLDFAPADSLGKFIKSFPNINYRSADLFMEDVDDKIDITDMSVYPDENFDVFLCSHVLEHIPDDIKAMRELYRVLKPDGFGIAMVPIILSLDEIHEDPTITDEGSRWKYFGQNDHVRTYSKRGFVERLESVGFTVKQYGVDYFGEKVFALHGIHPRSVLYIVNK